MDKIAEIWASLKQLLTSRTIWGGIILLLQALGVDASGLPDIGGAVANAGDAIMSAIGALLVLIGYVDRRPKPGFVQVRRG